MKSQEVDKKIKRLFTYKNLSHKAHGLKTHGTIITYYDGLSGGSPKDVPSPNP